MNGCMKTLRISQRNRSLRGLSFALLLFGMILHESLLAGVPAERTEVDERSESSKTALPQASFLWMLLQLVPSPQWTWGTTDAVSFGMRWQLTPVLYSYGVNGNVCPWRFGVVDPVARQCGSVEIFLTPEYISLPERFEDRWLFRAGTRAYFPLWQKGEYLSCSLGASFYSWNGQEGMTYEGGAYLFGGFTGIQLSYSPALAGAEWTATFRVRIF